MFDEFKSLQFQQNLPSCIVDFVDYLTGTQGIFQKLLKSEA